MSRVLGGAWAVAGHSITFGSRTLEKAQAIAKEIGTIMGSRIRSTSRKRDAAPEAKTTPPRSHIGDRFEGVGVEPDIEVPFTLEYAQGADPHKERAIEVALDAVGQP